MSNDGTVVGLDVGANTLEHLSNEIRQHTDLPLQPSLDHPRVPLLLLVLASAAAFLALGLSSGAASAHGNNSGRLANAGWTCFPAGPASNTHCVNPGGAGNGHAKAIGVMVFSPTGHPFLGTELLISNDVYNGQPCATDGGGAYHDLSGDAPDFLPFSACHHYDTGP